MKISIVGTGYVGLVTGVTLSEVGHEVTCIDTNSYKIEKLRNGQSPIYEPGIEELITKNIKNGNLHFEDTIAEGSRESEIIYLAVGTPQNPDGSANLDYIWQAVKELELFLPLDRKMIIVIKSTVPVGTNRKIKNYFTNKGFFNVDVASNPEFLREGLALKDTFNGDRIIIGSSTDYSYKCLCEVYSSFSTEIYHTTLESAELIKYASNTFLATKISFINEIANLCSAVGANITEVSNGMGMDHRIGQAFLQAGIGYGGSCFPKDTHALDYLAKENHLNLEIIQTVIEVNEKQKLKLVEKMFDFFEESLPKQIAILGLAFKPNTDDIREAPSLSIITELLNKTQANLVLYDPVAVANMKQIFPESQRIIYATSVEECLDGAEAAMILTEWDEFRNYPIENYKKLMRNPILFDGRNIIDYKEAQEESITYFSIGGKKNVSNKIFAY